MAESWIQKRANIMHWLKGIQQPSSEPVKESDRELTSSSDISAPDQTPLSSATPIFPNPHTRVTTLSLQRQSKPMLVNQPLASFSDQPVFPSAPVNANSLMHSPPEISRGLVNNSPKNSRYHPRKTQSPLPPATPKQKLPSFGTFDKDDDFLIEEEDIDLKHINRLVNRPPSNPMRVFVKASTSPNLSEKRDDPSASIVLRGISKSNLQTLSVVTMSRKKSLSDQDISQLVEKERRLSKGRFSSDSQLETMEKSKSPSSTGAIGPGSDISSNQDSSEHGLVFSQKVRLSSMLSAGSMDVLETRRRERGLGLRHFSDTGDEDSSTCISPALLSPTSPPPRLSRQSRLSRSPSPTPPSPTPIVPLTVCSEPSYAMKSLTLGAASERGISKSRLKQFNRSQQFSFDTTNDENFTRPSRHPKFLKNNFLVGMLPHSRGMHCRSQSDISSITHGKSQHGTQLHTVPAEGDSYKLQSAMNKNSTDCQYKSQSDLSWNKFTEAEDSKPLTLVEQIQLRKAQTEERIGGGLNKTRVLRQDSGLGTLSTIS